VNDTVNNMINVALITVSNAVVVCRCHEYSISE